MEEFFARLKEHKLVQWLLGYAAVAVALIPVLDVVAAEFGWPEGLRRGITLALIMGFFVVLVLAWYHGERGAQKMPRSEVLLLAGLVVITGVLMWRVAPSGHERVSVANVAKATAPALLPAAAGASAHVAIPAKSIAVLPFENLSADKDNAYFVAGMQDLILTKLADINDLKVIARTSTAMYASHPENLTQIGQQLGVATILEGSVQKAGNEVLINVQLIDCKTDAHIWAEAYTKTLDNVFGVEGEVAQQIATSLDARLSPAQSTELAAVPTTNPVAYDAFLRAEYQANLGDTNYATANWKAAIPLYRQAVAQDPKFALAYARLSMAESDLAWSGGGGDDPRQLYAQARSDAEQALKLAPDLPAAHIALGDYLDSGNADSAGALKAYAAALKLKPNDAGALRSQGYVQRRIGHVAAALVSLERAFALDPRNSGLAVTVAQTYMMAGRWSDAETALQRALAIDLHNLQAKFYYSQVLLWGNGDVVGALAAAQGDEPLLKLQRVSLLTLQRNYPAALALLDSVPDTSDNFSATNGPKAQMQADLYRLMNDPAKARPLYRQALVVAEQELPRQQGILKAYAWQNLADAELGLGQTQKGLQAIAQSLAIVDQSGDRVYGTMLMADAAQLYGQAGRADLAVPLLAKVLVSLTEERSVSGLLLWLAPQMDPIRHDPGFLALQKQYAKYKPAVIYPIPPASMPASASSAAAAAPASSGKPGSE